jgi:hypothetical protein
MHYYAATEKLIGMNVETDLQKDMLAAKCFNEERV